MSYFASSPKTPSHQNTNVSLNMPPCAISRWGLLEDCVSVWTACFGQSSKNSEMPTVVLRWLLCTDEMQCVFVAQAHGSGELPRTLWLHVIRSSRGLGKNLLLFMQCYLIPGYSQPRKRQDSTNGSGGAVPCMSGNSGYELYWLAMVSSQKLSAAD